MLTLFTVPRPFKKDIDIIQHNAIKSWSLLSPKPEIILIGDDYGVGDVARELGAKHTEVMFVDRGIEGASDSMAVRNHTRSHAGAAHRH